MSAPSWRSARLVKVVLLVALLAAMGLDTTWRSDTEQTAAERDKFDPKTFAEETYESEVVPAVLEKAVPLPELLEAFAEDPEAAGEEYGERPGSASSFSFAVEATAVAGPTEGSLMQLQLDEPFADTRVSIQVGPAINGSALRDAVGLFEFGDFVNQVEYADAAAALNTKVKQTVLADVDPAQLEGTSVHVVGAVTLLTPDTVTITPVVLEPAS